MKAIYSSKLYKASKRKDKIKSALSDNINVELVKQLRSYLDDEYQDEKYLDTPDKDKENEEPTEQPEGENARPDMSENDKPPTGPAPKGDHNLSRRMSELDKQLGEEMPDQPGGDSEPQEDRESADEKEYPYEGLEESTKVSKEAVYSSTAVEKVALDADVIKGTLNFDADTAGVVRIKIEKDEELWIFYNDKTNLNNVMENVIAKLNACGYYMLEFNRHARTDNAIVFQINSVQEVKPGGEDK